VKTFPTFYFEWDDPHGNESGWMDIEATKGKAASCHTVGIVIREEPDHFVLTSTIAKDAKEPTCWVI
jgi:hypothetical protein